MQNKPHLSPQELRVLEGIAKGGTHKTIARTLGISPYTTKGYILDMRRRLGNAKTSAHAVSLGYQYGLLKSTCSIAIVCIGIISSNCVDIDMRNARRNLRTRASRREAWANMPKRLNDTPNNKKNRLSSALNPQQLASNTPIHSASYVRNGTQPPRIALAPVAA